MSIKGGKCMSTKEIVEKLVSNGLESEKKAKSIITWHQAFGFVSVVVIFNVLSALLKFDWGFLTLICAVIAVIWGNIYVGDNVDEISKLQKSCKIVKISTIIMLFGIIAYIAIQVIYVQMRMKEMGL